MFNVAAAFGRIFCGSLISGQCFQRFECLVQRYTATRGTVEDTSHTFRCGRGAIWAKVEILRRTMGQEGLPAQRSNQFGRAADFTLLEAKDDQEFRQKCEDALSQPLSPAVSELLRVASNAGLSIAVVEMPMRQAHRRTFYDTAWWQEYVAHVRKLLAAYPATFIDASHWILADAQFDDALHLGQSGAEEFSRRLGSELRTEMATVPALRATSPQRESGTP